VEQLYRELYNWNEWLLLRFFRVITGLKLAFNPNLKEIYLIPIGKVNENKLEVAKNQMANEFGIRGETLTEKIEFKKAVRGAFLNPDTVIRGLSQVAKNTEIVLLLST